MAYCDGAEEAGREACNCVQRERGPALRRISSRNYAAGKRAYIGKTRNLNED